jgi:hypothetical protein
VQAGHHLPLGLEPERLGIDQDAVHVEQHSLQCAGGLTRCRITCTNHVRQYRACPGQTIIAMAAGRSMLALRGPLHRRSRRTADAGLIRPAVVRGT